MLCLIFNSFCVSRKRNLGQIFYLFTRSNNGKETASTPNPWRGYLRKLWGIFASIKGEIRALRVDRELQSQIGEGFVVYTPQMPNKQNAKYEEWAILFKKLLEAVEDGVVLIGHSLGAAFLVKYLSEHQVAKQIKSLHLLGTPFDGDMESDKLVGFVRTGELSQLERQVGEIFFYHSKDDFAVPYSHFLRYQEALPSAHFRAFEDRNHFLQSEVPELNTDLMR